MKFDTPALHDPVRGPNETQQEYRERQRASRKQAKSLRLQGIGTQRKAPSSRDQLRDSQRRNAHLSGGSFGRGLDNKWNREAAERQLRLPYHRDEYGAFTIVGKRDFTQNLHGRKWLAGISAQRGF